MKIEVYRSIKGKLRAEVSSEGNNYHHFRTFYVKIKSTGTLYYRYSKREAWLEVKNDSYIEPVYEAFCDFIVNEIKESVRYSN